MRAACKVLVVAGPTAVGKSELAVALAEALDAEIIGADSRQVYRYMDIGTAKPGPELRARVPHHLIDVVDPDEHFDVASWRRAALRVIGEIAARGRRVIVCGGTGLYLASLTRGLFSGPAADRELRERLEQEERRRPGTLHARLGRVDPQAARRIHPNDRVRLIRALEVLELTGKPLSVWHGEQRPSEDHLDACMIELVVARERLHERIEARSRAIVQAGLLEELSALRARGYARDLRSFAAIGYREAGACLDGELAAADLAGAIARATRQYAKRQLVWLRGQARTLPVTAGDTSRAFGLAQRFFSSVAKRQGIG